MNKDKIEQLEERLRAHINHTRWIITSIPFMSIIATVVYFNYDFLMEYGFAIYCVALATLGFIALWIYLLIKVTITEDD